MEELEDMKYVQEASLHVLKPVETRKLTMLSMVRKLEHDTQPDSQPHISIQGEKDSTERNDPTPRSVSGSPQTPRSEDCSFAIHKYIRNC